MRNFLLIEIKICSSVLSYQVVLLLFQYVSLSDRSNYDSSALLNFRRRHHRHRRQRRRLFIISIDEATLVSGWHRSMERSKLHRHYYDQKRVGSYGGVAALQRVVPGERDVERWLSTQDAYTFHKPVRRLFKRHCVVVGGPNQQWQADLVDMSRLKRPTTTPRSC